MLDIIVRGARAASIVCGFTLLSTSAFAALTVVSSSPQSNAVGVPSNSTIVVSFNQALDPATVTPQVVRVTGRYSGPAAGTLSLNAAKTALTFTPARPFFVAEWVTMYVSSALKSATAEPLANGHYLTFAILAGTGSKSFTLTQTVKFKQTGEGLIRLYGFSAIDVDGDGSPDMSAADEDASDIRVRLNDGCGHPGPSKIVAMPPGQEPSPNIAADLNGDARPDLVTGNQTGNSVAVFRNDGLGGYLAPTITSVGGPCHGVALLDIDADGDLDVLGTNLTDVRVLKNDGTGNLTSVAAYNGGGNGEWQVSTTDANLDGRADAYVANNGSGSVGLLIGNASGGFMLPSVRSIGSGPWAVAAGDVDGDGAGDCVVTNNGNATISVVRSNGSGGTFATVKNYSVGTSPVSAHLADLDGDSDLDLTIACFGSANCYVFFNQAGTFVQSAVLPAKFAGSCSSLVDFDRDGDVDVIVTDELSDEAYVFTQDGPAPASVQPPTCAAALRIDNYALRSGFGNIGPHAESIGDNVYVGISGGASQPWLLLLGTGAVNPVAAAPGYFNLAFGSPIVFLASGFGGGPFVTDAFGESRFSAPLPALPVGIAFTLQGAVGDPAKLIGATFTNPESIVVAP